MKRQIKDYTFAPGAAGVGTVTFDDFATIRLDSILLIVNITRQVIIFNLADTAKGGTVATNVLTLEFDTTTHSSGDKLYVVYDDADPDLDSGAGTAYRHGVALLVPASGGPATITGDAANGLDVDVTRSALPTGAATAALQGGGLPGALGAGGGLKVDGSGTALPVTVGGTPTVDVSKVGGTTTDTGSGNKSAGTQRVVLATDQPALTNKLLVTPDLPSGAATAALQGGGLPAALAAGGGLKVEGVSGGVAQAVVGPTASGSSVTAAPQTIGGRAATTTPTAVTDGQAVNAMLTKHGKQVVVMSPRELVQRQSTTITSSTSETTIVTAPGASTYADLVALTLTNTSTVNTKVTIRSDTASSTNPVVFMVPALSTVGIVFSVPLAQDATNKPWTIQCATSVSALEVTAQFIKST